MAEGQVFAQVVPLPTAAKPRIVKEYQRDYPPVPGAQFSFTSLEAISRQRTLVEGLKRPGGSMPTRDRLVRRWKPSRWI